MPANLPPAKEQCGPELMLHAMGGEWIDKIHAEQNGLPIWLHMHQRELRLPEEPMYPDICQEREGRAVSIAGSQGER